MSASWKGITLSAVLLALLLVIVAALLAVLGSIVLVPQGSAAVVLTAAALVFVGAQILIFRVLGLRSAADEDRAAKAEQEEDESPSQDWRAWRG